MGHVRNYSIGDAISRFQRMQGKEVFQPMGFDAFGMPAENAALEKKVAPATWTYANIEAMKAQMHELGFGFNWQHTLTTCDSQYYRWEQWFFIAMFQRGLAYRKQSEVNWDPIDQTVLANEQVIDGRGWRSGALVEKKTISQWFLKITDYADELLQSLNDLEEWPDTVRRMQSNWIGKSKGVLLQFVVEGSDQPLTCFTTRPDTLMGSVAIAVAPEHPIVKTAQQTTALSEFLEECQQSGTAESAIAKRDKKGVDLGINALHPITGEAMPIWVANFVLMDYGTGSVMMVPGHDQRDWECAQMWQLPIVQVVETDEPIDVLAQAQSGPGRLVNSGIFDGLTTDEAFDRVVEHLQELDVNKAEVVDQYRLRDWGVSRQRYWGAPIPMIHCQSCGIVPVPESELPVELPVLEAIGDKIPSLEDFADWHQVNCPECGGTAKRDTDTFDTFFESSWYQARYLNPEFDQGMVDKSRSHWLPVDQYVGGVEHAILHLLYARFFHKVMRDLKVVDSDEPFARLLTQGMVLKDGSKMSKSRGNTIAPEDMVAQYGADAVRMAVLFAAPPEADFDWDDCGIDGCFRFLNRLWKLCLSAHGNWATVVQAGDSSRDNCSNDSGTADMDELSATLWRNVNHFQKRIEHDYSQRLVFHTPIAAVMELTNGIDKKWLTSTLTTQQACVLRESIRRVLIMLTPVSPHICHQLWHDCQFDLSSGEGDPMLATWPSVDEQSLAVKQITIVVQVNGKRRSQIEVSPDIDKEELLQEVKAQGVIDKYLEGKKVIKTIVVPKKIVNLVVQ